jgi:flagellar hook assembly protein FlgD
MEILSQDVNGVLSVLVYSMNGTRIPAGNQTLFTVNGIGTIAEVSAADSYGRLLDATASLETLPTEFAVNQNYPNPFNAQTLIRFDLPEAGNVTVNIYSITGQLVKTLGGQFEAGHQSVTWNASDAASGVYFYKVSVGDHSQTMKMTLVK